MSVVVPTWESVSLLLRQLDALAPQVVRAGAELAVVDDHSGDGTAEAVRRWSEANPGVALVALRSDRRRGPNASRNAGVAATTAPLVAFTDGDDQVAPGWLDALVQARVRGAVLAGMVTWAPDEPPRPPLADFFGSGIGMPSGSCMAIERHALVAVGGFDERIRRGGTESELALRLVAAGYGERVLVPGAVLHVASRTDGRTLWRQRIDKTRGHAYLGARNRRSAQPPVYVTGPRGAAAAALRAIRALPGGTRTERRHLLGDLAENLALAAWSLRWRAHLPPARLAAPDLLERYEVVVDTRSGR